MLGFLGIFLFCGVIRLYRQLKNCAKLGHESFSRTLKSKKISFRVSVYSLPLEVYRFYVINNQSIKS